MEHINFTKMQGAGNDYIYIDCLKTCPEHLDSLAREMSDRHYGVGGDGIILILPSSEADFKMRIFNADGSEARMCGNGSRCVAKYVYDNKLTDKLHITLETLSGVKHLYPKPDSEGRVSQVAVDMGSPDFLTKDIPVNIDTETFIDVEISTGIASMPTVKATAVSMGNPHLVVFVSDIDAVDIAAVGYSLENNQLFPDRTNVEFVQVISPDRLRMRVWERGSGITLACGTGACAALCAAVANNLSERKATVCLDGGNLDIEWNSSNHVIMTGPATTVFTGVYKRRNNEPTPYV